MKKIICNSTFCYIMAAIFYIVTIVDFIVGKDGSTPITWMCIGSMWLCISTVYKDKSGNDTGKHNKDGREDMEDVQDIENVKDIEDIEK